MVQLTLGKALGAGLGQALRDDERVLIMGEDIGRLGGVFRVTDGLLDEFGPERVVDTPLAESGIVGTAVGLAMRGYRPVVEIQFDGFVYPAFNQIVTQVAKLRYRTGGRVPVPLTIRIPSGGGIGAAEHHSESPEAYFAHTAGLRVVAVATAQDAYSGLREAISCDDPVIFFEPKRLYHARGEVQLGGALAEAGVLTSARVVRAGSDVTVVTYGAMVPVAIDAASAAEDEGISLEVIDLRALSPVDYDTLGRSVRKTGRVVVVHEASREAGLGAEIVSSITERFFDWLEAAPVRVTGHDIPYPPSKRERHHLPDLDRILHGVDQTRENLLMAGEAGR